MNTVMIIGASGFLGKHLMSCCPGTRKVGTYYQNRTLGLEFLDLSDPLQIRQIITRVSPSIIIYAAGITDVDKCENSPGMARQINAHAIAMIGAYSRARIVYVSTDYVFDGIKGLYSEDDEAKPLNIYGETKVAGEKAVLDHNSSNMVVRVSGLYDDNGVKGRSFLSPVTPVIRDDIRLSSPVHVDDVVSAINLLIGNDKGGIYHIAGPDVLSRYEFWQLVSLRCLKEPIPSTPYRTEVLRPQDSSLSTQKMQSIGWRARPVSQGLPTLKSASLSTLSHFVAERQDNACYEGLLIDCVGGLLTRRTWLPENKIIADIDQKCATVLAGPEFWRNCTNLYGLEESEVLGLQENIAFRYTPNPPLWSYLRRWKSQYKLALVNNGPSATFRRWVQKYGLDQVFNVLANSEELGVRKPEPEFINYVIDSLSVRSSRCVLIDDDPKNIAGARFYGLSTIQTRELHKYPLSIHELDEAEARSMHL